MDLVVTFAQSMLSRIITTAVWDGFRHAKPFNAWMFVLLLLFSVSFIGIAAYLVGGPAAAIADLYTLVGLIVFMAPWMTFFAWVQRNQQKPTQ